MTSTFFLVIWKELRKLNTFPPSVYCYFHYHQKMSRMSFLSFFHNFIYCYSLVHYYHYSRVFFSYFFYLFSSLNFWNSSQPILFGGMLMAKFAALSNHTTSKCQRRKGKRCRIPKVKTNTKQQICIYYNNQEISESHQLHVIYCSVFIKNVKALRKSCTKSAACWKNETFCSIK